MREQVALYIAGGSAVAVIAVAAWRAVLMRRPTAEEVERLRRLTLHRAGKMADAMVLDVHETSIQYSYDVRGVEYTATQDISALENRLPAHRMSVAGPAAIKYDPRNPANSIVLCEDWSGLRQAVRIEQEMEE